VEAWLFGVAPDDPALQPWRKQFSWKCAGVTSPAQTAALLNEVDVFADFSTHQAMGLTALEAMACGAAVIVPAQGGAVEFVRHEVNGLVADTSGADHCAASLERLIGEHALRAALQRRALEDAASHYPERVAARMLEALFGVEG
jgi:glycosyltransferase involved in cell wall biosynthesis